MYESFPFDNLPDVELLEKNDDALHLLWVARQLSLGRLTEIELRRAELADPLGSQLHDEDVVRARAKLEKRLPVNPDAAGNFTEESIRQLEASGILRPIYRKETYE